MSRAPNLSRPSIDRILCSRRIKRKGVFEMSGWRWVIGLVLLAHGVGHTLGVIPLFQDEPVEGWNLRSWLLTDALGEALSKGVAAVLFIACTVVFVLAGLSVLGWGIPENWWKPLATAGAIASAAGVILFWNAFPALVPNKMGALAVNIIILGNWVNVWDWPTDNMIR